MDRQKYYSPKEKLTLIILFIASVLSLLFFIKFRTAAFPEHDIKFKFDTNTAQKQSEDFLKNLYIKRGDYKKVTIFSIDEQGKTYLEREVGVDKTSELGKDQVDIWHFDTRFFKPQEEKEYIVSFTPGGRFSGYTKIIPESEPGANITQSEAQNVAVNFLTVHTRFKTSDWQLVSSETNNRPQRVDHNFVWEKKDFKVRDATYRIKVDIFGDEIGGYQESLHIPDDWLRIYQKELSENSLAQTVAEAVTFIVFGLAILVTFTLEFRKNNLRLKTAFWVAAIFALVNILTSLNSLPLIIFDYPTTQSWNAFLGSVIFASLISGLFQGLVILLIYGSAEAMYRQVFTKSLALEKILTVGLLTKPVNKALLIGVVSAIFLFAYEIIYYFLGQKVGFWAPADINYSDSFSTLFPWIYPLFIGFSAATMEEGIFRLFGIPFLTKVTKRKWLAILITAVSWGFLHSNYPQSPWFVRGLEVSAVGILFGILFTKFGILASLSAHYTFNALQLAIFFYTSNNPYIEISSTLVSLLPGVIGAVLLGIYFYKRGFREGLEKMINKSLSLNKVRTKIPKRPVETTSYYHPLSKLKISLLLVFALLSLVSLWQLYSKTRLDEIPEKVERGKVVNIAQESLAKQNVDTKSFETAIDFNQDIADPESFDYIMEKASFTKLKELYPYQVPTDLWSVRFFKPLEKQEYTILIWPSGDVYSTNLVLDEKTPGPNLTQEEALIKAKQYLTADKGYKPEELNLADKKIDKKDNRTDYSFIFDSNVKEGDAVLRINLDILGDKVSGFSKYLKLPENWQRDRAKTDTTDLIAEAVLTLTFTVLIIYAVITFLTFSRENIINIKFSQKVVQIISIIYLIGFINSLPSFYDGYDTSVPLTRFIILSSFAMMGTVLFAILASASASGMLLALWQKLIGAIFPMDHSKIIRDALVVGYTLPVIILAVRTDITYFLISNYLLNSYSQFSLTSHLSNYLPALSFLETAVYGLIVLSLLIIALLLLLKIFKKWSRVILFIAIIFTAVTLPKDKTVSNLILTLIQNAVILVSIFSVVFLVIKNNLLSYMLSVYTGVLLYGFWELVKQPNTFFQINGVLLLLLALMPLILYLSGKISFIKT